MLKIISWNILQGGGSRSYAILQTIINAHCSIAILSEFKNNASGKRLLELFAKNGFTHQISSNALPTENSVCIVSKFAFKPVQYVGADIEYNNNIIGAQFESFTLVGVYLPHKKKHTLLPFITNLIANSEEPYIIAGDYNTGHNYIDQKGNSFWYQTELKALESTGYVDAYRLLHGNIETYSWFSHQGNGYRYDHTYVHPDLIAVVKKCYYLQEPRQDKISDHAPMILELG